VNGLPFLPFCRRAGLVHQPLPPRHHAAAVAAGPPAGGRQRRRPAGTAGSPSRAAAAGRCRGCAGASAGGSRGAGDCAAGAGPGGGGHLLQPPTSCPRRTRAHAALPACPSAARAQPTSATRGCSAPRAAAQLPAICRAAPHSGSRSQSRRRRDGAPAGACISTRCSSLHEAFWREQPAPAQGAATQPAPETGHGVTVVRGRCTLAAPAQLKEAMHLRATVSFCSSWPAAAAITGHVLSEPWCFAVTVAP
jgi:hypothetical protein